MNPHRMPLHIGDYQRDTAHLHAIEHGAYMQLLMHYWTHDGLPNDEKVLARIACVTPAEWRRIRPTISAFFHDGWHHKRVDQELGNAAKTSGARSTASKNRWSNRTTKRDANASPKASANGHQMQKQLVSNARVPDKDHPLHGDDGLTEPRAHARGAAPKHTPTSKLANDLADEALAIIGIDPKNPPAAWCGTALRLQTGLDAGWKPETILAGARAVAASRQGAPPRTFHYLEKVIADEHAKQSQPIRKGEHHAAHQSRGGSRSAGFANLAYNLSQPDADPADCGPGEAADDLRREN